MRAQPLVRLVVRALAEEQAVEVGQRRGEPVRVVDLAHAVRGLAHRQSVAERRGPLRKHRLEETVRVQPPHRPRARRRARPGGSRPRPPRKERPDRERRRAAVAADVGSQDCEGIRMTALGQGLHVGGRQRAVNRRGAHTSIVRGPGVARARVYYGRWLTGRSSLAAYGLVFGVLLAYWWRVERGIRALERATDRPSAGRRDAAATPAPRRGRHRRRAGRTGLHRRPAVGRLLRHAVGADGRETAPAAAPTAWAAWSSRGRSSRTPGSREHRFLLTDGKASVPVYHRGIPPDLFGEGRGAVVEGTLGADGTFQASTIMAKHSEEYRAPEGAVPGARGAPPHPPVRRRRPGRAPRPGEGPRALAHPAGRAPDRGLARVRIPHRSARRPVASRGPAGTGVHADVVRRGAGEPRGAARQGRRPELLGVVVLSRLLRGSARPRGGLAPPAGAGRGRARRGHPGQGAGLAGVHPALRTHLPQRARSGGPDVDRLRGLRGARDLRDRPARHDPPEARRRRHRRRSSGSGSSRSSRRAPDEPDGRGSGRARGRRAPRPGGRRSGPAARPRERRSARKRSRPSPASSAASCARTCPSPTRPPRWPARCAT